MCAWCRGALLLLQFPLTADRVAWISRSTTRAYVFRLIGQLGASSPVGGTAVQRVVLAALPKLGDLQVDGADPRVPRPRPVAVPRVRPLRAALAVAGSADRVDYHEQVDHLGEHRLQRVRRRLLDLLAKPLDCIDAGRGGHRPSPCWKSPCRSEEH